MKSTRKAVTGANVPYKTPFFRIEELGIQRKASKT
jgi:hypothetical protein